MFSKPNQIFIAIVVLLFSITSCEKQEHPQSYPSDPLAYVNPFIGTGGHGHTYPGASSPFGMVQLSPDSRLTGWDGCSGYHYSDSIIFGFSHTHLSGTGVSDYGDILLMPVNNGKEVANTQLSYDDYKSTFLHEKETASAGFYSVHLDKPNVDVALSTTPRCGIHQYTFNDPKEPAIVLDLEHRDEVLACDFRIVSDRKIEGYRNSKAWAEDQHVYFVMEFSEPFTTSHVVAWEEIGGHSSKAAFLFAEGTEQITVKVAISAVDIAGAQKNFDAEIKPLSFEETKSKNEERWRTALSKIEANCLTEDEQTIFYSGLYHSMLAPNIYNDVDGKYRGMDLEIHQDTEHTHYTVFSLWDTHRAAHPLYTIIDQERTADFIHTMLQKHEQGGILPIWDLSACYTGCMIGYHGVSVIADAHAKGIKGYDEQLALQAMMHSANQDHLGLEDYKNIGFIEVQNEAESVSKTLEYAYDDWCIAQMAKALGDEENYQKFSQRSLNYRNLFDPESKFFRPRENNFWKAPFDPFEVNSHYTEANAWHYAFSVAHDLEGLINLHGGKVAFEEALDNLFKASSSTTGRDQVDITGLIGQYAHGNEPSHHIAYLYNYINKPWKTQQRVREILDTQYHNLPDGVSGNEDCGQMSAWYVLSAMGFYAVVPGSDYYVIGSPSVNKARINLENGKQFEITTANNSAQNIYIQSVMLNGQPYENSYLKHDDIMNGGNLHLEMGPEPNMDWGVQDKNIPNAIVETSGFLRMPYFAAGERSFVDKNEIRLATMEPNSDIFYNVNDGPYEQYDDENGILLEEAGTICVYAKNGEQQSATLCTSFFERDGSLSLDLKSEYANIYNGGVEDALIDGLKGGEDYRTGGWQGFEGQNLECTVDLSELRDVKGVSCGFLQDENSWIFFPSSVEFYGSDNGEDFVLLGTATSSVLPTDKEVHIEDFSVKASNEIRYVKMKANGLIKCPEWHKGAEFDGKAWVFADEVKIEY